MKKILKILRDFFEDLFKNILRIFLKYFPKAVTKAIKTQASVACVMPFAPLNILQSIKHEHQNMK